MKYYLYTFSSPHKIAIYSEIVDIEVYFLQKQVLDRYALAPTLTVEFAKDCGILECGPFVLEIDPILSQKSCINR